MYTLSTPAFRIFLASVTHSEPPILDLVQTPAGYVLELPGLARLKTARGAVREFRTADAAVRFVRRHFVIPLDRPIFVRLVVAPGLF